MESKRLPCDTIALRGNPSWLTATWSLKPLTVPLLVWPHLASGSCMSFSGVESTIRCVVFMFYLMMFAVFSMTSARIGL